MANFGIRNQRNQKSDNKNKKLRKYILSQNLKLEHLTNYFLAFSTLSSAFSVFLTLSSDFLSFLVISTSLTVSSF